MYWREHSMHSPSKALLASHPGLKHVYISPPPGLARPVQSAMIGLILVGEYPIPRAPANLGSSIRKGTRVEIRFLSIRIYSMKANLYMFHMKGQDSRPGLTIRANTHISRRRFASFSRTHRSPLAVAMRLRLTSNRDGELETPRM